MLDDRPKQTPSVREVADRLDGGLIHAAVDELLQLTVGSDHTKRGVLRPRDIPCRLNNAPEHGGQRKLRDDGAVGA